MSDIGKNALKTKIDNKVYENSSQAITGTIMNEVLQDMVDTLADGGNLDAGSVNTANIADGAITTDKIADGNVKTDKIEDHAVTKDKLEQNVSSDLDWAVASNSYYRNSQAGDVAAKVITTYKNMSLIGGGSLKVTFEQANTADDATLNIDGKGAKPLYYNGKRVSSTNSWEANETVEIYYNNYNSGIYYAKRWMVEPVSVSQNTETDYLNLNIGNDKEVLLSPHAIFNYNESFSSGVPTTYQSFGFGVRNGDIIKIVAQCSTELDPGNGAISIMGKVSASSNPIDIQQYYSIGAKEYTFVSDFYDIGFRFKQAFATGSFSAIFKSSFAEKNNAKLDGKVNVLDIVDNLTSNATNKPLSAKQGNQLEQNIEVVDSKENYFVGKGSTFSRSAEIRNVVPGRRYRITLKSRSWDTTGISTDAGYKLQILNIYNGASSSIVGYSMTQTPPQIINFTAPDNCDAVVLGGRAVSGLKVYYDFEDITQIEALQTQVNEFSSDFNTCLERFIGKNNTYSYADIKLIPNHRYRIYLHNSSWDTTGVTTSGVGLFSVQNSYNGSLSALVYVEVGQNVNTDYLFLVPSNSDFVRIGGRATQDTSVYFEICDEDFIKDTDYAHFNAEYYRGLSDWKSKSEDFSALMTGDALNNVPAVDKCESFLFFTDPHTMHDVSYYRAAFERYMAQIQKMFNSTPTDFVLCGGDWLGNGDTPDVAAYKLGMIGKTCYTMFQRCYLLVGNHDTNYQGKKDTDSPNGTTRLPNDSIRNLWYYWNEKKQYYSFEGRHTKFYCFDTGTESQSLSDYDNYGYEQCHWFANALLTESSEHIAIALHIYNYLSNSVYVLSAITELVMQIATAYNNKDSITFDSQTYDFASAIGKIEFVIGGHRHEDDVLRYTDDGADIPVILTKDLGNGATYPVDASFDLVFVDYDNNKIQCIRVGNGSDREILL